MASKEKIEDLVGTLTTTILQPPTIEAPGEPVVVECNPGRFQFDIGLCCWNAFIRGSMAEKRHGPLKTQKVHKQVTRPWRTILISPQTGHIDRGGPFLKAR